MGAIFIGSDPAFYEWCNDLFDYYWQRGGYFDVRKTTIVQDISQGKAGNLLCLQLNLEILSALTVTYTVVVDLIESPTPLSQYNNCYASSSYSCRYLNAKALARPDNQDTLLQLPDHKRDRMAASSRCAGKNLPSFQIALGKEKKREVIHNALSK